MKILMLLLLPFFSTAQIKTVYKNLALEGGGLRGIAYAGAFKALEENGTMQQIENIAGSSAGAIAGLMISIGYKADEIDSILMSLQFQKFNDGKGGLVGKYKRIKRNFGFTMLIGYNIGIPKNGRSQILDNIGIYAVFWTVKFSRLINW